LDREEPAAVLASAQIEKQKRAERRDTAAVASANVELVRSIYAAWARGDFSSTEWADPEIEYVNPEGAIEPGTRHGIDEFTRAIQRVFEGWETWNVKPERFESAANQVAVVLRYAARGRSSGVTVKGSESALWTLRNGRVVRYEWFHDPEDALHAVGLVE
jgi:ketosteroid isomerase-like protein